MGNLFFNNPPFQPRAKRIHLDIEEPPERVSAFVGLPTSGGVIFGVPSRDGCDFHYHAVLGRPPGSTAWRLRLLRTSEPKDGKDKGHTLVWETPPIAEGDLHRWGAALVRRFEGVELVSKEVHASGFGLASHARLNREGWMPCPFFPVLLRRMRVEREIYITNADVLASMAAETRGIAPDVLMLFSQDEEPAFNGLAFRLLNQPEEDVLDTLGLDLQSEAQDAGPYYLYARTTLIRWTVDLLIQTGMEAVQDRGLREKLKEISEALEASRNGVVVDWSEILTFK